MVQAIKDELRMDNVIITKDFLWDLLSICDLLVAHTSTVGLEAMLFGKPVVVFHSVDISPIIPYSNTSSVVEAYNVRELVSAIRNVLYDEETIAQLSNATKQFICDYVGVQDAKSHQRVANLIEQMISDNPKLDSF